MMAVVIEYQISEKVNTVRRPYWSATWPRQIAPTNRPANRANTKVPMPATPIRAQDVEHAERFRREIAGLVQPWSDIGGEEQVVELEAAAERDQRDQVPDVPGHRQPIESGCELCGAAFHVSLVGRGQPDGGPRLACVKAQPCERRPATPSSAVMQNIMNAAADPIGWHGTTILCVRRDGHVTMAGDGQVSMGQTIVKGNARKVRRIGAGGAVSGRLRRRHRRRVHPARTAGEQAGTLSRPARTRLRRAGEGLAHRPLPAPAGGDDGGGRQGPQLHADRQRRRAGAGGRRHRHRLRRQLRTCRPRAR